MKILLAQKQTFRKLRPYELWHTKIELKTRTNGMVDIVY